MDPGNSEKKGILKEGKAILRTSPSGKEKGPGKRDGVFYNPAMVINRDISVLMIEEMVNSGLFPKRKKLRILDGMSGTGIRALRMEREVRWEGLDVEIVANDRDPKTIENASENTELNDSSVLLTNQDLTTLLAHERYDYIDIDPFGSPVNFIDPAVRSILNGGIISVTATDTAALTGSIPRVALRRYGAHLFKTYFMHEVSARVLMGYVTRVAASRDLSATPLYFYSSDHFVRGYVKMEKGAKKTDENVKNIGYLSNDEPDKPRVLNWRGVIEKKLSREILGPLWTGTLSDSRIIDGILKRIDEKEDDMDHISNLDLIGKNMKRALREDALSPGGFDLDVISGHTKIQQPKMDDLVSCIYQEGLSASRSRFSDKIIKTDANMETLLRIMKECGGN